VNEKLAVLGKEIRILENLRNKIRKEKKPDERKKLIEVNDMMKPL
jgi:hypothetical protein